MECVKTERNW